MISIPNPESLVILIADNSASSVKFDKLAGSRQAATSSKEAIRLFLTWVCIAVSNAKRSPDICHNLKNQMSAISSQCILSQV